MASPIPDQYRCPHGGNEWCDCNLYRGREFSEDITEHGALRSRWAFERAQAWTEWAAKVEELATTIPSAARPELSYLADDGVPSEVFLGARVKDELIVTLDMLRRVAAAADGDAAAWRRAAQRISEGTARTLSIIAENDRESVDEPDADGGESDG